MLTALMLYLSLGGHRGEYGTAVSASSCQNAEKLDNRMIARCDILVYFGMKAPASMM
jgi:hypothetical protein